MLSASVPWFTTSLAVHSAVDTASTPSTIFLYYFTLSKVLPRSGEISSGVLTGTLRNKALKSMNTWQSLFIPMPLILVLKLSMLCFTFMLKGIHVRFILGSRKPPNVTFH